MSLLIAYATNKRAMGKDNKRCITVLDGAGHCWDCTRPRAGCRAVVSHGTKEKRLCLGPVPGGRRFHRNT